ncbi:hypothetical protein IWX90DRAFT_187592 [Phyllosticta citrichinensis]|uniref:Uncharacterized protein n=1 Tax=Phyllosticta citrichinensis TaxID=1130410 RepID=A0ABR1XWP5_9PEZI
MYNLDYYQKTGRRAGAYFFEGSEFGWGPRDAHASRWNDDAVDGRMGGQEAAFFFSNPLFSFLFFFPSLFFTSRLCLHLCIGLGEVFVSEVLLCLSLLLLSHACVCRAVRLLFRSRVIFISDTMRRRGA